MSSPEYSLKTLHTFAIDTAARKVVIAESPEQIVAAARMPAAELTLLLLGEGSNVLFLEAFSGIVVINRIKGIAVNEDDDSWRLHVGAGENWHRLVTFTLQQGIGGPENLALIPAV